jgi:hypothetical protein
VHRARIDAALDWLKMQLHFEHALPDRCGQQTVPLKVRLVEDTPTNWRTSASSSGEAGLRQPSHQRSSPVLDAVLPKDLFPVAPTFVLVVI